jgi:hypothetical protein
LSNLESESRSSCQEELLANRRKGLSRHL